MKLIQLALVAVLSAAVAYATTAFVGAQHQPTPGQPAGQESAYDRVLHTGVLRCGYADWPPYMFKKDPTTGQASGLMADVTEAVAGKLKLRVEWAESEGWGSFIESLRAHRIDAFCPGVWRNGDRGRYVAFAVPIFYNAVYAYVAPGEHRFDKDLSLANAPEIRISLMDGEMSDAITKEHFPKATTVSIPQLGQLTDTLVNVATHKADIVFSDSAFADDFIKSNPGKLRRAQDKPFQFFPASYAVDIHETQLREMLDSALVELHNSGVIEEIISKYNNDPAIFLRVAKPYAQP